MDFSFNPRTKTGRRLPPKEWFYYMVERVLKNLKKRGWVPRPGSPHRTPEQVAPAIAAGIWWGTVDGMLADTKRAILNNINRMRAAGKIGVVTGRKGFISRREVERTVGKAAAERVYSRLVLAPAEIREARKAIAMPVERIPARKAVVANPRKRMAKNPELLMVFGNPPEFGNKRQPPEIEMVKDSPEFKAALRKYREFHGVDAEKITRIWVDSDVPKVGVVMGEAPDVTYHVKTASNKQKRIPFKHEFKGKVFTVTDARGKAIFLIPDSDKGKNVRVTDWVRG